MQSYMITVFVPFITIESTQPNSIENTVIFMFKKKKIKKLKNQKSDYALVDLILHSGLV